MDDPQQQNRPSMSNPWRFKGVKGVTLVHPQARVLSIACELIYDGGAEPRQKIGMGSAIQFEIPGRNDEDDTVVDTFLVLETADEVAAQIAERGGWR
jgi:hypothetical protein